MAPVPLIFAVRVQRSLGTCQLRQASVAQQRTRALRDARVFLTTMGPVRTFRIANGEPVRAKSGQNPNVLDPAL